MSELFAVTVEAVSEESARLAVRSVHPDSGPVAPTATFALMLMYDPIMSSGYYAFRDHAHLESSALARAMDREDYLDADWVKANARAFVAKAKVVKGTLEIWPTHPAWIEHLRKGMAWETAAYDAGPGKPAKPRVPTPPDEPVTRSQEPHAGFRVGEPKDSSFRLKEAFIPLHGPNRYVADPLHEDPITMRDAARDMLGQPLLLVPLRGPSHVGTLVELRTDGMFIYGESGTGWGGQAHDFAELRSMGRAWLKEPPAAKKKTAKKKTAAAKKTVKKKTKKKAATRG